MSNAKYSRRPPYGFTEEESAHIEHLIQLEADNMKTKHTPGPWRHHGELINSDSREIAVIPEFSSKQDSANARLIAAAPELLEALEYILSVSLAVPDEVWAAAYANSKIFIPNVGACDVARDAIKKATGGAE